VTDWIRFKLASPRYRLVYQAYWRIKTHPWLVAIGVRSLTAIVLVFLFRARLAKILAVLDPGISPQLCIGVGAALIGLIAVVFTLSLFVIQQISDRSVPGILREYAADGAIRTIYATLSETGIANVIVTPDLYERERLVVTRIKFIIAEGALQNQDGVIHVKAVRLRSMFDQTLEVHSHDFH
jgi:hypothetical protein